jgi:hypothetical protein
MQRHIVIHDEDSDRTYSLAVTFHCCDEIGGAPGVCCDVDKVELEGCVVWLNKCGMEVRLDTDMLRFWESELLSRYSDEITEKAIAIWHQERWAA